VTPIVEILDGNLSFGRRTVWSGLDLRVEPGQLVAVVGPNGSGKSSLLKVVLGQLGLSSGQIRVHGEPPTRGSRQIGYVPQQRGFPADTPMKGADFVQLGIDGTRWGPPMPFRHRRQVENLLGQVDGAALAKRPMGLMSGGEQQRLRIAQALASNPQLLLCDEPLLSLDLHHQRRVVDLIDRRRRRHGTSVMFVTHDINPVLPVCDLVLYMIDGAFRIGTPEQVMRSDVLSALFHAPVEVIHRRDKIIVVGGEDPQPAHHDHREPHPIPVASEQ
jgi:zinc/manganese transport system ATP-binding protein